MKKEDKIYIAGHRGLVGSAILRCLQHAGYNNFVTRTSKELDLVNQADVRTFFEFEKPKGFAGVSTKTWVIVLIVMLLFWAMTGYLVLR